MTNRPRSGQAGGESCAGNAAPYVLGALADSERQEFERHMASCAVCREEVASLQVAADALATAAPQLRAPAQLKQRVIASVREDARAHREQQDAVDECASGLRGDQRERRGQQRERHTRARERRPGWPRWRSRSGAAVAVLVAAVVALAIVALSSGSGSGGHTRVISAQVLVPRASATLSLGAEHAAQLRVSGMPQAGAGRVYEVWRKGAGAPQPTDALFTVNSAGHATVSVPGGVAGVREVLVTSEPLGGSRVPTRAAVIVARVS